MTEDRIREIIKDAEERYERFISLVIEVPKYTLNNLPLETAADFIEGRLYEFTEYRKEFGGRLIFICHKTPEGHSFFMERFRIYGRESLQGIERADDPGYIAGISESIYRRIPDGSTLLDLGCGAGKYLAALSGTRVSVLATDISKELIEDDRRSDRLRRVNFFPGDCTDLRFLKDKEIDYLTGVNILNVLYPDMVASVLNQGARVAKVGALFAFALPARADIWSDYSPDLAGQVSDTSSPEYVEKASNHTFLGQMRLFSFVRGLCREKGWRCRVFRFLDRSTLGIAAFNKTLDSRCLPPDKDSLLKLLEFPVRRIAFTGVHPQGSRLVCAVGYGLEIYFGDSELPQGYRASYFDNGTEFERLDISSELNESIRYWELPFKLS